jgi:hypothetical protein
LSPSLIGIGCSSHILHNTFRNAISRIEYDVESFANSITAYFHLSISRWDAFSSLCEEMGVQKKKIPSHTHIRWLTFSALLSEIIRVWDVLKQYFNRSDDTPKNIRQIFCDEPIANEYKTLMHFVTFISERFNRINTSSQVFYFSKLKY